LQTGVSMNDGSQPSQVIKTPDPDGEGVAPDYPCRVWDLLWSVCVANW
jgi:hypothetical protein